MGYLEERAARKNGLAPALPTRKEKKPIPKLSSKKQQAREDEKNGRKKEGNKVDAKLALDIWFSNIKDRHWGAAGTCRCMECGLEIYVDYSRHATAHLLPKKLFKSVSTHPLNYMIYGAGCGCHVKTDRVDKFVKMKTWSEAARRIKEMIPLLPFDELKYLSSQLMTALDNTP